MDMQVNYCVGSRETVQRVFLLCYLWKGCDDGTDDERNYYSRMWAEPGQRGVVTVLEVVTYVNKAVYDP